MEIINKKNISYILMILIFSISLKYNFISLLFMMTLTYILVRNLNSFLLKYSEKLRYHKILTKFISMFFIGLILFFIVLGINESFIFIKNNFEMIVEKLTNLTTDICALFPFDIKQIISLNNNFKENLINLISHQHEQIYHITMLTFHFISNCFIGIFLGLLLAFNHIDNKSIDNNKNLEEFKKRIDSFIIIFEKIFLGQGKISLINTVLTGIYLFIIMPISGHYIPYSEYLLFFTFVLGLLPIIGNLISNILILMFSITLGIKIAIASLIFLIIIHKLEYYINGLILGKEININLFETIIAMVIFEGIFGFTGLFIGTLIYSYIKIELKTLNLI